VLSLLRIRNLAIVDEAEIEFGPGLNVITGETGAGKSILLKAIELLTGVRTSASIIRAGASKCEIEGLFVLDDKIRESLAIISDEIQERTVDDELLIKRVIDASGRNKIYLNGELITVGLLQHLSEVLIDVTGQHSHVAILDTAKQRILLDQFGVDSSLLSNMQAAYSEYLNAKKKLDSFQEKSAELDQHILRLSFERDELKEAALSPDEDCLIEEELKRLSSVEMLTTSIARCLEIFEESEIGLEQQLVNLDNQLTRARERDKNLSSILELVESSTLQLGEAKIALLEYASSLEQDPERLEYLRERLSMIKQLTRKYNKSLAEICAYLFEIEAQLAEHESGALDLGKLQAEFELARTKLISVESKLSSVRKTASRELAKLITSELATLNMKRAQFIVQITKKESSSNGADNVEFLLAANPGEPFQALKKVASGGELSRVLLILKTILNYQIPIQVFDEVDTGIGGAVAQVVGERLSRLANNAQVILVTHAPQIAAFADNHFKIDKLSRADDTKTVITELNSIQITEEIARMLAGKKISKKFEESAKELLSFSRKYKRENKYNIDSQLKNTPKTAAN
jgi:DNA repair protein RecN (Recombination protein N)